MLASDWMKKNRFFALFTGWSSYGYDSKIGNIRGSALVIGFDYGVILILVPSWFTSWSFFWLTYMTGTFGGTAGGFAFLNI